MVSPAQSRLIDTMLAPAALNSNISSAIAAKSLDAEKQQGAAVIQLLDAATAGQDPASDPYGRGATLDMTV